MTNGQKSVITKILTMACILIFLTTVINAAQHPLNNVFSIGTPGNFQGPSAEFYGVALNTYGSGIIYYDNNRIQSGVSARTFSSTLDFDPDAQSSGYPNLVGEETSVYIPQQSVSGIPAWLPMSWLNTQNYITNPQATYAWNVTEVNGTKNCYYMEQWLLRYYVSFSAEWDGSTDMFGGHGEAPPQNSYPGADNSFSNLNLWIQFNLEPKWYIQGQGTAYFAIGKIQLADTVDYFSTTINHGGIFDSGKGSARGDISVAPESQGAIEYLYNAPYGTQDVSSSAYQYQGHDLNPAIFRDKIYMNIDFRKFGVYGGASSAPLPVGFWTKGDVVTMPFDVTVFVFGQWDVKDIQQNPGDFGRFQRTGSASDFFSWLFSASTLSWLLPIAIFVALLFFAPWVILALIAILRGGKK